jgi:hypothetical protein
VNQAHSLRRTIEEAEAKLRELEALPRVDDFPHGTVVRVTVAKRHGDDTPIVYALLKVIPDGSNPNDTDHKWYYSGAPLDRRARGNGWMRWDEVVSWLVHDVRIVSWEEMTALRAAGGWVAPLGDADPNYMPPRS